MKQRFLLCHIAAYPIVLLNDMVFLGAYFFLNPHARMLAPVITQIFTEAFFFLLVPLVYASRSWKKIEAYTAAAGAEAVLQKIPLRSSAVLTVAGVLFTAVEISLILFAGSADMFGTGLLRALSMIYSMLFSYILIPGFITWYCTSQFLIRFREELFVNRKMTCLPAGGSLSVKLLVLFLVLALAPLSVIAMDLVGAGYFSEFSTKNFYVVMDIVYVLLGVVLAVFFLTDSYVRPLTRLTAYFDEVRRGDYSVRAPVLTDDEVGRLSRHFNQMTAGLEEREYIKRTFGRYMGAAVASEILSGALDLSGHEREVTVLFTDIENYTSIAELLSPREVVALLNTYFTEVVRIIDTHNGVVNKFIGDAVMALFNAPVSDPDHADNALRAARAIAEYSASALYTGGIQLKTRIGINTGPVIVGNIGSAERLEYTAIGDTVNTAQRLEALNKECASSILMSESTVALLKDKNCRPVGEFPLKGRRRAVRVYTAV